MTGKGSYSAENDRFVLDVKTTGRWTCNLKYVRFGESVNVTGKCDGKSINEDHDDADRKEHQAPTLRQSKEN
jgi:hypothetical protein